LGDGDFVSRVLAGAEEKFERKYRLAAAGYNLDRLIHNVAEVLGISSEEVVGRGKARQRVEARSLLCYWANTELGIGQGHLAQRLGLKQPAVSLAVRRGEGLARERKYTLGIQI